MRAVGQVKHFKHMGHNTILVETVEIGIVVRRVKLAEHTYRHTCLLCETGCRQCYLTLDIDRHRHAGEKHQIAGGKHRKGVHVGAPDIGIGMYLYLSYVDTGMFVIVAAHYYRLRNILSRIIC